MGKIVSLCSLSTLAVLASSAPPLSVHHQIFGLERGVAYTVSRTGDPLTGEILPGAAGEICFDARAGAAILVVSSESHDPPADTPGEVAARFGAPHPNPTKGPFLLRASTPDARRARVALYDARGRVHALFFDGILASGEHAWSWSLDAVGSRRLACGVYFLETTLGEDRRVTKIVLGR